MHPAFGVLRHIERRESNGQETAHDGNHRTVTQTLYAVMITRIIVFWLTVWTHESEYPIS